MPGTHIALLRGINVGSAKRLAMADLRKVAEGLGWTEVRTLLNSGNLVFSPAPPAERAELAEALEAALAEHLDFRAPVTVITGADLQAVIAENPFQAEAALHPPRLLVSFPRRPEALPRLAPSPEIDWWPERAVLGSRALYTWHPDGLSAGRLALAASSAAKDEVTARNWATVLKLQALTSA